jgi:NAD(P)H-nitrite reductase large subunit
VEHARAIRSRARKEGHLVVIGGGILGLETALRALDAGMRVTVLESAKRLMPRQFGERASGMIFRLIRSKGIDARLGQAITHLEADAGGTGLTTHLRDGERLRADLCIVSAGARPDLALARSAALEMKDGVKVDKHLHTSSPVVWAAGDIVEYAGRLQCSARGAALQGQLAARNAVAALRGEPPQAFANLRMPVALKLRSVELHATGEVAAEGREELLLDGCGDSVLRALVVREGITIGVQMVGTGAGFDQYAGRLGQPVTP